MKDAPIELLKSMLEIYSPSGKEKALAFFLMDKMRSLGFDRVRMDRVGNVYGEIGSGSPSVLLCGHMDTVLGEIHVRIEDNKVYGRGAVDAKSSLAAMISAASSLELRENRGKVMVAGVVEEERKAKGIRQLLREQLNPDYAIFGEPSGVKNITFAYKGKLGLRVVCKTSTGHIGARHLFDNAIERAYELWDYLKKLFESQASPHSIFYSITPCLVAIHSRGNLSATPGICILDIDIRLPPTVKCDRGISLIKEAVGDFQKKTPNLYIDMKVMDRVEPFVAKKDSILIGALREAIEEVVKEPSGLIRKTGTGDMNIFGTAVKIPVATYGPGDGRLSHTINEYINIKEYLLSIEVYKRAIEKLSLQELP